MEGTSGKSKITYIISLDIRSEHLNQNFPLLKTKITPERFNLDFIKFIASAIQLFIKEDVIWSPDEKVEASFQYIDEEGRHISSFLPFYFNFYEIQQFLRGNYKIRVEFRGGAYFEGIVSIESIFIEKEDHEILADLTSADETKRELAKLFAETKKLLGD